jgi:DNA-binding NarL/FixJ family response regulator
MPRRKELKAAIERVVSGETLFAPASLHKVRAQTNSTEEPPASRLTARELAVLRPVAGGYSNKEIGRSLGIPDGTVKNHLTEIFAKLEARDRTQAVFKAIAARFL